MARRGEVLCGRKLVDVTKRVGPRRKRFNRRLPSGQAVTIGGLDTKGRFTCYRLFYFKTKQVQELTVGITIEEHGKLKDPDPAFESVLRSICEPAKRNSGR